MNIKETNKKIDDQIDFTLKELKIQLVANIVSTLNKVNKENISSSVLELSTNEKRMRRDCFYDPQETFDNAFFAQISVNDAETIDLKNEVKEAFMFGMKYRPTNFYLDFYIEIENYDANQIVNQFVNGGFFGEQNSSELFSHIMSEFKMRNIDVSNYQYHTPDKQLSYNNDSAEETTRLKQLMEESISPVKVTKYKF